MNATSPNRSLIPPLMYFWRDKEWGALHWTPKCPAAFYENPAMYGWKREPVNGALIWDGQNLGLRTLKVGKGLRGAPAGLGVIARRRGRRVCVSCYAREYNMAQMEAARDLREAVMAAQEEEANAPGDPGATLETST